MKKESHISSIIVYIAPEHVEEAINNINNIDVAEVAVTAKEQGKLVVVIDCPTTQQTERIIQDINQYRGVVSTALVYHHVEPDIHLDTAVEPALSESMQ